MINAAIASALASLGAFMALFGGFTPLSSQALDTLPPGVRPPAAHGSCDPGVITAETGATEFTAVLYCDGQWARIGIPQSDGIIQVVHVDGRWTHIPPDGHTGTALPMPCYHWWTLSSYSPPPPEVHLNYC